MDSKIKLALKSDHMDNNIIIKPAIISPINQWSSMHWHDFYELEIILDGQGQVICDDNLYNIKPGMVSFLSPIDMHKFIINDDIKIICIQFTENSISEEILDNFFNIKNNVIYLEDVELKRVLSLCELLSDNPAQTSGIYNSKLLEALLISLKNKFGTSSTNYKGSPPAMQKALSYINTHFKENPKMSDIANMVFLNNHYFCSLFKEYMGETYKDYVKKLKLSYAQKLILYTSIPLTQISLECGYSSHSNFNRDFKKFFGFSPSEMRDN